MTDVEFPDRLCPPGSTHALAQSLIAQQLPDAGRQGRAVPDRDKEAVDPVLHHLPAAHRVRGHDGPGHGRRLQQGARHPLTIAGQDVHVAQGGQFRNIPPLPEPADVGIPLQKSASRGRGIPGVHVPGQQKDGLGPGGPDQPRRLDVFGQPLVPDGPGDHEHHRISRIQAKFTANGRGVMPVWVEVLGVDPHAADDADLALRDQPLGPEIGRVVLVDEDRAAGQPAGDPVERLHANPHAAVAEGVLHVEGAQSLHEVVDDRHAGHASGQGAVDVGLGRECVQDIGPELAQQGGQTENHREFTQGVETGSVNVVMDSRDSVIGKSIKHVPPGTQGDGLVSAFDQGLHDGQAEKVEVEIKVGEEDEFHKLCIRFL